MEPISIPGLMVTIGLITLFVIFVQAHDAKSSYKNEEEPESDAIEGEKLNITEAESLSRKLTAHERRVEDKLDKIYGVLNFFKTLVIIQIAITVIGILFTISKIGIAITALSKLMPYL